MIFMRLFIRVKFQHCIFVIIRIVVILLKLIETFYLFNKQFKLCTHTHASIKIGVFSGENVSDIPSVIYA